MDSKFVNPAAEELITKQRAKLVAREMIEQVETDLVNLQISSDVDVNKVRELKEKLLCGKRTAEA